MQCCGLWLYFLLAVVVLLVLVQLSSTVKYCVKYYGLGLYCIVLALSCGLFCLFHKPGSSQNLCIAQFFMRLIRFEWLFGIDIQVEDKDKVHNSDKPCVIVSNHQSSIDALIVVKASPNGTAPLAKKVLLYIPIFGVVCWLCGTVFINRKKGKTAIETMKKIGSEMKEKMTSLWIFPEGTRYQYDKIQPFKKGAFHLAIQAHVPLVPAVVFNYRNVLDRANKKFDGGPIRVKFLDPIDTTGLNVEDVNDLIEKVHKVISDEFEKDFQKNKHLFSKNALLKTE